MGNGSRCSCSERTRCGVHRRDNVGMVLSELAQQHAGDLPWWQGQLAFTRVASQFPIDYWAGAYATPDKGPRTEAGML